MGTVLCRYGCGRMIQLLPVAARGGKKWPFERGFVPYNDDPDAGEQWAYRADRGGVIDLSTTTDKPDRCLVRHTCAEYAKAHVEKMMAEAEQAAPWTRARAHILAEVDEETYLVAQKIHRPAAKEKGGYFQRPQILAMVCRGEITAPERLFQGMSFDVPLELAHRAAEITKTVWAFYHQGLVYKPAAGEKLRLTGGGQTQLCEDYRSSIDLSQERPEWLAYEPIVDEVVDWGRLHAERPPEPEVPRYNLSLAAQANPEIARWRPKNKVPRR